MDMLRNLASQAKMAVTGHKEPASPTSPQAAGPSPLTVPQVCEAVSCPCRRSTRHAELLVCVCFEGL